MPRGPIAQRGHDVTSTTAFHVGDDAITALMDDQDARHLYLTAVASRVLEAPWEQAGKLAIDLGKSDPPVGRVGGFQGAWVANRLAAELSNRRDAAARWCATVLLTHLQDDVPDVVWTALRHAGQTARRKIPSPCWNAEHWIAGSSVSRKSGSTRAATLSNIWRSAGSIH